MKGIAAVVGAVVIGAALLACATPPLPRTAVLDPIDDQRVVAFVDVTIVDGTQRNAHTDVVVLGDSILAVGPTGTVDIPERAQRIVGHGRALLPGFVDAHTHISGTGVLRGQPGMTTTANLERWLRVGVTTVFDLGGDAHELAALRAQIAAGDVDGPEIKNAHRVITGRGSHPITMTGHLTPYPSTLVGLVLPQIDDVDDIPPALDAFERVQQQAPADILKIVVDRMPAGTPIMPRALLMQLVREAKRRGHLVFVHAGHVDDAVAAAEAGADVLAHLPWRGRFTPDQLSALKACGVVVVPTAAMWTATAHALHGDFMPSAADTALVPAAVLAATRQGVVDDDLVSLGDELVAEASNREANLKDLIREDIRLLVGTDAVLPGSFAGSGFTNELETLIAAGASPETLIMALTTRPARLLGDVDGGRIVLGARADLVLLSADPNDDVRALLAPELVMKSGRVLRQN